MTTVRYLTYPLGLGILLENAGQLDDAYDILTRATKLFRGRNDVCGEAQALSALAVLHEKNGDLDRGVLEAELLIDRWSSLDDRHWP